MRHQHEDREKDRLEGDDHREHAVRVGIEERQAREGQIPVHPAGEKKRVNGEKRRGAGNRDHAVGENFHRRAIRRVLRFDRAERFVDARAAAHPPLTSGRSSGFDARKLFVALIHVP